MGLPASACQHRRGKDGGQHDAVRQNQALAHAVYISIPFDGHGQGGLTLMLEIILLPTPW